MTILFWLAGIAVLFATCVACYIAGYHAGHADTKSAYLDALDWLAAQHDRRMRGA